MSTPIVSIEDVYAPGLDDQETQERERYEAVAATLEVSALQDILADFLAHDCLELQDYLEGIVRRGDNSRWMDTPTAQAIGHAIARKTAQILDDLVAQRLMGGAR